MKLWMFQNFFFFFQISNFNLLNISRFLDSTRFSWLTHYSPVLKNIWKTKGFLMFSKGIEQQHWAVVG